MAEKTRNRHNDNYSYATQSVLTYGISILMNCRVGEIHLIHKQSFI